jgi:hypothetical protein
MFRVVRQEEALEIANVVLVHRKLVSFGCVDSRTPVLTH